MRLEVVSVGIDVVEVGEIEAAIARFGSAFLRRVFTAGEVARCGPVSDARLLAGCFAGKEATRKLLPPELEVVPWRSVEVHLRRRGKASVELCGAVAEAARGGGIEAVSLSVDISRRYALAVALATRS
jgi:holo-[acyl-carrier protein] synthase